MRRAAPAFFLMAVLVATCGCRCLGFGRPEPPPPPPISRWGVIQRLAMNQRHVKALVDSAADAKIQHQIDGDWETDVSFGATIAFDPASDRPGGPYLYTRAEKVGVELFTFKMSGDSFCLRIPDTKEYVYGTERALSKLPEMIRAEDLQLMAIDASRLDLGLDAASFTWNKENYVFDIHYFTGSTIIRVLVDRRNYLLKGISLFDLHGNCVNSLQFRDHRPPYEPGDWPVEVPYRIIVRRPPFGLKVTVKLDEPKMREQLPAVFFKCKAPARWRQINLNEESVRSIKALQQD